jgi:hypothetical protein
MFSVVSKVSYGVPVLLVAHKFVLLVGCRFIAQEFLLRFWPNLLEDKAIKV